MKRLNRIMTRRKGNETTQGFMTRRRWVGTFTCRQLILVYTVVKSSLDLWLVNFRSVTYVRTKRSFFFLQSCSYECAYLWKRHENDKIVLFFNLENHVVRFYLLVLNKSFVRHQVIVLQKESHMIYIWQFTMFFLLLLFLCSFFCRLIRGTQLKLLLSENPWVLPRKKIGFSVKPKILFLLFTSPFNNFFFSSFEKSQLI